ncbi:APC family permease [Facilibium subflavum]|uniref:APC family permease n=1 Tax=Facilibium subflavum TaxID=2219058 RepID=UPI000E65287B|nr:APC family permease [Facilibium subflavum]
MYPTKPLTVSKLTLINITAIISLSSIAYMATIGLSSIIFYLIAGCLFLIPTALVSAELGGMLTADNGGVYTWVKAAFGEKAGVVAIWMEWFNNVISFPATLSALVATVAYMGFSELMNNKAALWLLMFIIFWLTTLFNFLPIKKVVILNIIGALFGMILPGLLLLAGALYFIISGKTQLQFTHINNWLPSLSFATFALFVKTLSGYSGIQATSFHIQNIDNPKRNVPRAILYAIVIIFLLSSISTAALIIITPSQSINPMNGLIQGISSVLILIGLGKLQSLIAFLIALGMLAALSTWMLAPARAIQEVAHQRLLPKILAKKNKNQMPVNVLLIQGIFGSLLSFVFLFMPTIQSAFAMLIALTSQFTVFMWIMVFASAIYLRFKQPNRQRVFRIGKKGNKALIFICSLGILACLCGLILGIFPPGFSHIQNITAYISIMLIADSIIILLPLIWIYVHKHQKINPHI